MTYFTRRSNLFYYNRTINTSCLVIILIVLCANTVLVASVGSGQVRENTKSSAEEAEDFSALDLFSSRQNKNNQQSTALIANSKPRDFGLTLKAILLGPLIGLTIKGALIKGILWSIVAYGLHLFLPALLPALGLGTGLVGFARQLQPDYSQMLASYVSNLRLTLPKSLTKLTAQYQQVLGPIIESFKSIPEGHCRFRAVCETAKYLIKNTQSMSVTLQRISATLYMQFGSDYSKAWLDGVVQGDCVAKYPQCTGSPFSMVATRLAQALGATRGPMTGSSMLTAAGAQEQVTASF